MEQWYAVYDIATGALYSTGTVLSDQLPAGLASVALPAKPGPYDQWNTSTHTFDAGVAPTKRVLSKLELLRRFTAAERAKYRAALKRGDENAEDFDMLLNAAAFREGINLDSADTQAGLAYLASINVIAATRVAEIRA